LQNIEEVRKTPQKWNFQCHSTDLKLFANMQRNKNKCTFPKSMFTFSCEYLFLRISELDRKIKIKKTREK